MRTKGLETLHGHRGSGKEQEVEAVEGQAAPCWFHGRSLDCEGTGALAVLDLWPRVYGRFLSIGLARSLHPE